VEFPLPRKRSERSVNYLDIVHHSTCPGEETKRGRGRTGKDNKNSQGHPRACLKVYITSVATHTNKNRLVRYIIPQLGHTQHKCFCKDELSLSDYHRGLLLLVHMPVPSNKLLQQLHIVNGISIQGEPQSPTSHTAYQQR